VTARLALGFVLVLGVGAWWPLAASADSYPYYRFTEASQPADGSPAQSVYSQSSCVNAYEQQLGFRCHLSGVWLRLSVVGPTVNQADVITRCQLQGTGTINNVQESCGVQGYCPQGGTLSGTVCTKPACSGTDVFDPESGECGPTKKKKVLGKADCPLCVGNPANAGTGTKFQEEVVWQPRVRSKKRAPILAQD